MRRVYPELQEDNTNPETVAPSAARVNSPDEVDGSVHKGTEHHAAADDVLVVRTVPCGGPGARRGIAFPEPDSEAAEQYRILRTRILQHSKTPRFVLISSAVAGDGKTTTAINLAWALALVGEGRVLLLEADLRRSSLHAHVGTPRSPGLAEVIGGQCQIQEALIRLQQFPNLYILPAGRPTGNAAELLNSRQWGELCPTLREHFQFVIADSPPVAAAADYELILASCDGVLLVVRPDHTKRKLLIDALGKTGGSKLIGILLNCVPKWFMWKNNYHDFYRF